MTPTVIARSTNLYDDTNRAPGPLVLRNADTRTTQVLPGASALIRTGVTLHIPDDLSDGHEKVAMIFTHPNRLEPEQRFGFMEVTPQVVLPGIGREIFLRVTNVGDVPAWTTPGLEYGVVVLTLSGPFTYHKHKWDEATSNV